MRAKPCAFTLMELLVALGIVALLAAILTPIFLNARKDGQKTLCVNNLRQLGQVASLYATDYDGFSQLPSNIDDLMGPYIKSPSLLICPLDNIKLGYAHSIFTRGTGTVSQFRQSYGYIGLLNIPDREWRQEGEPRIGLFVCMLHGSPTDKKILALGADGVTDQQPFEWVKIYDGRRIRVMQDGHIKTDEVTLRRQQHGAEWSLIEFLIDRKAQGATP